MNCDCEPSALVSSVYTFRHALRDENVIGASLFFILEGFLLRVLLVVRKAADKDERIPTIKQAHLQHKKKALIVFEKICKTLFVYSRVLSGRDAETRQNIPDGNGCLHVYRIQWSTTDCKQTDYGECTL